MAKSFHKQIQPFKHALSLIEAFRAADSDKDGSITIQELEGIKGLPPAKLTQMKAMMHGNENLTISKFLDLNVTSKKLGAGDEFGKALKSCLNRTNSKGEDSCKGEDLCEAIVDHGIILSIEEAEDLVSSIDNYGTRAISSQDLDIIVEALI